MYKFNDIYMYIAIAFHKMTGIKAKQNKRKLERCFICETAFPIVPQGKKQGSKFTSS